MHSQVTLFASKRHRNLIRMTFNPFSRKKAEPETAPAPVDDDDRRKKGPTPKRRDQEAANLRPLVPKDRKASNKLARAKMREKQDREYDAMKSGDLAHMPAAERLDFRIYIRDYVDARWNVAEFLMPVVIILLVLSMVVTSLWPQVILPLMIVMYAYFFWAIADTWWMWHKLKKQLIAKFGEKSVAKGMRSGTYAWSRAMQMRRWRLPSPRSAKRGNWPK